MVLNFYTYLKKKFKKKNDPKSLIRSKHGFAYSTFCVNKSSKKCASIPRANSLPSLYLSNDHGSILQIKPHKDLQDSRLPAAQNNLVNFYTYLKKKLKKKNDPKSLIRSKHGFAYSTSCVKKASKKCVSIPRINSLPSLHLLNNHGSILKIKPHEDLQNSILPVAQNNLVSNDDIVSNDSESTDTKCVDLSKLVKPQDCCDIELDFDKYAHLFDRNWDKNFNRMKINYPHQKTIGGKEYISPFGCRRIGIKVNEKYENDDWLKKDWQNAYYAIDPKDVICVLENSFLQKHHKLFGKGIFCYPNPRAALFLQTSQSTFQYNGKPYSILLQVRVDPLKYTIQYERLNTTKFEVLEVDDKAAIRPYGICLFPAKIHEKAIASINNQQLNSSLVQTYDCATGTCAPQINVIKYAHLLDSLYDYDFTREKALYDCATGACARQINFIKYAHLFDSQYDHDFTRKKDVTPKYIGNKQYLRPYGCLRLGIKVKGKYENEEWLSTTWHNAYHGTRPEYVTCILENGFKKSVKGSYGPGVYCTPNPKEALRYAILKKSTFNYKGIDYYVVLQTRVDPSKYKVVCGNDINKQYWLLGDENGIRAYAICLFPK